MSALRVALLLLPGLALAPAALAAGDQAAHGANWGVLALHTVNFAFLLYLLNRFARKPILDFLAQRSQGIRADLDAAQAGLATAESELATLRDRLGDLDNEARRIVAAAEEVALSEQQRAIERANDTAARLREDARRVAQQEIERARGVLRDEAADLAAVLAAEILRDKLTPADDKRLVQEFIDHIGDAE